MNPSRVIKLPHGWVAIVAGKVCRKWDGTGRRFDEREHAVECMNDRLAQLPCVFCPSCGGPS